MITTLKLFIINHQKNHEKNPLSHPIWCTSRPKGGVLGRGMAPDDLSVAGREAVHTASEVCKEKRVVDHGGQKIVNLVPESRGNLWENCGNLWKFVENYGNQHFHILCLLISMWTWPCFTCTCAYTLIISYAYTCAYMCIAKQYNWQYNAMHYRHTYRHTYTYDIHSGKRRCTIHTCNTKRTAYIDIHWYTLCIHIYMINGDSNK